MTERLKSADTPYRTDSEFEKSLSEYLPSTGEELKTLEKEYGGSFHLIIGQFLYIEQVTRFDTGFSSNKNRIFIF